MENLYKWTDELFDTHTVKLSGIFPKEFRFLKKKFMTQFKRILTPLNRPISL